MRGPKSEHGPTPGPCVGDCEGNLAVTIGELVKGTAITLGDLGLEQCVAFDCKAMAVRRWTVSSVQSALP